MQQLQLGIVASTIRQGDEEIRNELNEEIVAELVKLMARAIIAVYRGHEEDSDER